MKWHLLPAAALILMLGACKDGETIEDIGKYTITTADFEAHYQAHVESQAYIQNAEKSTFAHYMCHPERAPDNMFLRGLLRSLEPKVLYDSYREARIVEQAARQENFQDDPLVQRMMEQAQLQILTRLYIMKKLEKRIKVSDEEANAKCVELRKKAPEQFGSLTLEECKKVGFGFIREERMQGEYQKVLDEIKESVTIKKNQKFDRDDFLGNKIEAYRALRKSGGCEEPNSTPAAPATPAPR